MATTTASYSVITLAEAGAEAAERGFGLGGPPDPEQGRRGRVYVRRDFDINSFGVNAYYQAQSGTFVVGEHDELGPGSSGHEELYVVVEGGATFTVDGEEVEAPRGTAVFVGNPATKRSARATEDGTVVLVVGGRPGEAFRRGPGESMSGFFRLYREKDYEGALEILRSALEEHPGNALILYNIACIESCLGHPDEAWEPLAESLAAWPAYRELATKDEDLDPLRADPRFDALVA
jgi:quercetin dioxygenase-like cupin family protein